MPRYNLADGPLGAPSLVVYDPPHIDERIAAQSGLFTAHPVNFMDWGAQVWPDAYLISGKCLTVRIPSEVCAAIRSFLPKLGLHRARFFPDLDGIGFHLARRFLAEPPEASEWGEFWMTHEAETKWAEGDGT